MQLDAIISSPFAQHENERRFGGVARLFGDTQAARLREATACVVGVGGVGSWALEALARSGIGRLVAVDLDMVAESNTNRQIQALEENFGRAKVDVMAERIRGINPACEVTCIEDFITPENVAEFLPHGLSVVVDAIDQARAKAAMIAHCRQAAIPIVVAGAAGGKVDPTRIVSGDLASTVQDPLLARVRSLLRRDFGFPRGPKRRFGVGAVYSTEAMRRPVPGNACDTPVGSAAGLNCAGFGSSVCVTATFGMVAAAMAIDLVCQA